ncbi:MAG: hypothetical protein JO257_22660 [Deltaproteobacteria bacterium]|nr:hypothetical protein [Deltaproteobacteria bacterium]
MSTDDDDKRVKDILDAGQLADLERWFGLPSFDQLAEEGKQAAEPELDPDMLEVRRKRAAAIAAVDPKLLSSILFRIEENPETLRKFEAVIDVRVKEDVGMFDATMVDKGFAIAEPREVEISDELKDDLNECTPQALLRDLHRPETFFDKTFEIVDAAAEQRLDVVAEVAEAMRTSWTLPPLNIAPWNESLAVIREARVDRYRSWAHVLDKLPNRRVSE